MQDLKQSVQGAFAMVSVMVLAAAISTATLIAGEPSSSGAAAAQSFIGVAPEAASIEVQPPTF